MSMPPRIAVLGAGSWGTALAILLARNGAVVSLWARDAAQATTMQATRRNPRYLPDAVLPEQLVVGSDLAAAVAGCDLVLVVTPSATRPRTLSPPRATFSCAPARSSCPTRAAR